MAMTSRARRLVFSTLTESQLNAVEAVAMDMSAAYLAAANAVMLAENKIVHDRFHVMQHATEASTRFADANTAQVTCV